MIAYFSMEIGVDPLIPTYAGGLGVLGGDIVRAAADLGLPLVAVTLLHRKGYFRQRLDAAGRQREEPTEWNVAASLEPATPRVTVMINNRSVVVSAWQRLVRSPTTCTAGTRPTGWRRKPSSASGACACCGRSATPRSAGFT